MGDGIASVLSDPAAPPHASSAPDAGDVVGRDVLEARCQLLEQSVRASGHVPAADIEAARPGGAENRDTSAHGWVHFLCVLHRMHERGPSVRTNNGGKRWDDTAMEAVRSALAAEPVHVTLCNGNVVAVHPKSEYALSRLVVIDRTLQWVVTRRLALEILDDAEITPASLSALRSAVDLQHMLEREFVTICCAEGADIPHRDGEAWAIELAPWTSMIEAADIINIRQAHLEVNLHRIQEISERTRQYADGTGSVMPIAAFLGVMSAELRVQPRDMSRRWSLGEAFGQALLKWESQERAKADAKKD